MRKIGAYERRMETYLEVIRRLVGYASNLAIADIGCGSGVFSRALACGNFVVALGINRDSLKAIKRDVAVVNADAHHLPFKPESFDVVLSLSLVDGASEKPHGPRGKSEACC